MKKIDRNEQPFQNSDKINRYIDVLFFNKLNCCRSKLKDRSKRSLIYLTRRKLVQKSVKKASKKSQKASKDPQNGVTFFGLQYNVLCIDILTKNIYI